LRNVGIEFTVPDYPGMIFRADPSNRYTRDGGIEFNVRDVTNLKPGQYFVKGQVTRFYQEKDGTLRASNPTKSKTTWKNDTPAEQWLFWKPFAEAWKAEKDRRKAKAIERRKAESHCRVRRNGQLHRIQKKHATQEEIDAYIRGDKI